MAYIPYKVKDYSEAQLLAGITSGSLSFQVKAWQGALFPTCLTANSEFMIITLEKRTWTVVTAKERVLVSNRSWDTFTCTRSFGWDTAGTWAADDYVCLHVNSDIIQSIYDWLSDKLNKSWWTRIGMPSWDVFYTDGSGNEITLPLGTANTYLKSNGPTSAPSFGAPPLDVNGQTTDNTTLASDDFIPYYDTSEGATNKRLAKASTSVEWLTMTAQDADVVTWTDVQKYVTPKQVQDNLMRRNWALQLHYQAVNSGTPYSPFTTTNNYSTSTQVTKNTIGIFNCNFFDSWSFLSRARLQYSTDNTNWNTIYDSPSTGYNFPFGMQPWFYRVWVMVQNGSSSANSTPSITQASLTFTN